VSRLDLGDETHKLLDARSGRPELVQHIRKRDRLLLRHALKQLGALRGRDELERHRVGLCRRELGQCSVERLARSAEQVHVLLQELEDRSRLDRARLLGVRERHKRVRLEAVPVDEVENLLRVVPSVDTDRLSDLVLEASAARVELEMEDVSVVRQRGESSVLRHGHEESLVLHGRSQGRD